MSHRYHPEEIDAILYDDCEECEQRSNSLAHLASGLDRSNLLKLWNRMIDVEKDDGEYPTVAEARAGRMLYFMALVLERIADTSMLVKGQDLRLILESGRRTLEEVRRPR